MKRKSLSIGALDAFTSGDVANFLVAATPGGIEAQEAAGQAKLVEAANLLPGKLSVELKDQLWKLGFRFVSTTSDDLFDTWVFPAGWKIQATNHPIHNDLLDDKGRRRGGMFYKAAFYDRSASLNLARRYRFASHADAAIEGRRKVEILDFDDTVLHYIGDYAERDWDTLDKLETTAKDWLNEKFPSWEDPLAHWD